MLDDTFPAMGTIIRVVRDHDGGLDAVSLFSEIERRLSRFDPASDLSRLNAHRATRVPSPPLLRTRFLSLAPRAFGLRRQ